VPALRGGWSLNRADLVPRHTKVPNADTDATTRRLATADPSLAGLSLIFRWCAAPSRPQASLA
jgi:hypothetical protein